MLRSLAKYSVYAITTIDGEFLMYIQIFITTEAHFFLNGIYLTIVFTGSRNQTSLHKHYTTMVGRLLKNL